MNIHKENDLNVLTVLDDELELLTDALDFTIANCLGGDDADHMVNMITVMRDVQKK